MKPRTKTRFVATLVLAGSATASASCGTSDDSKTEVVVPAQGGAVATGGTVAGAGRGGAGGTAAAGEGGVQVGAGGVTEAGANCVGLAGPDMVEITTASGTKFCVDRTEVTQGQYALFLGTTTSASGTEHPECAGNATYEPKLYPGGGPSWEPGGVDCIAGKAWTPEQTPNRPVGCIDWCDAYAFCAWAGKRLCGKIGGGPGTASTTALDPNDAALNPASSQWYFACSQGGKTLFPYGDTYDPQACESWESATFTGGMVVKDDVGANPSCRGTSEPFASIVDLSGSVMELTDECALDTSSPGAVVVCAARGGGYSSQDTSLDCKHYGGAAREVQHQYLGFRCCRDLP